MKRQREYKCFYVLYYYHPTLLTLLIIDITYPNNTNRSTNVRKTYTPRSIYAMTMELYKNEKLMREHIEDHPNPQSLRALITTPTIHQGKFWRSWNMRHQICNAVEYLRLCRTRGKKRQEQGYIRPYTCSRDWKNACLWNAVYHGSLGGITSITWGSQKVPI